MKIYPERMTAEMDGDFVIFVIGMRINTPWKFWKWLPVMRAMPKMIQELSAQPDSGFLNAELGFGRTILTVQYWRSVDDLIRYAHSKDSEHLPAWREFNRKVGTSGDVGIWHETYQVKSGACETVYLNMPAFGLGKAGRLIPAAEAKQSARGRLGQQEAPAYFLPGTTE